MSIPNPFPVTDPPERPAAKPDVEVAEIDGRPVLDPDANDDLIDSATADRLAAEHGSAPDRSSRPQAEDQPAG